MAKAPIPGKVKTRLTPPLTPDEACALNACFLRDTVASLHEATLAAPAEWVISYTPQGFEAAFLGILEAGAYLLPQRGDGFGERLLFTAEDLFACGFSAVCLIDSDSPTVPTKEFITAAISLLQDGERAVLGPSEDGGYYLIGLQRPVAELFERITWSTAVVAEQTLQRAEEVGLPMESLRSWYDVDDADSLARLHAEFFDPESNLPRGYPAPHTREFLTALKHSALLSSVETETSV
ncbi:Glycosyltransferase [Acidisarcina polymorpha]|uniref:Glycosyltransferase n=2 Tax=Acidisarcina polymorpha TaxID=2211140 RepID=A0A2Z5FRY1_9BACT|nr:Glycosyltransferase [Acidisarcina polymorpha]